MAAPYNLPEEVAPILAQICCFENCLPQGAPTSPIISNMICARMDTQLQRLAKEYRCFYTRYADDLSFSTTAHKFPHALAFVADSTGEVSIGHKLFKVINDNGFKINYSKVRLQSCFQHQEVTGLTVNEFPNVKRKFVRHIRAILNDWEKNGLDIAREHFREIHAKQNPNKDDCPPLEHVVKGKIEFLGMVRGKEDQIYLKFLRKLQKLAPELVREIPTVPSTNTKKLVTPLILTEGKTDRKHLIAALKSLKNQGQFLSLNLEFDEHGDGNDRLLQQCEAMAHSQPVQPHIFIFDRDIKDFIQKVSSKTSHYKFWGNTVFSFIIPVPDHRNDTPDISIEFFYKDNDLQRKDTGGKRIFISSEFNPRTTNHLSEGYIYPGDRRNLNGPPRILEEVYGTNGTNDENNFAMSKNTFADNILNQSPGFEDIDFSEFSKIFRIIESICDRVQPAI